MAYHKIIRGSGFSIYIDPLRAYRANRGEPYGTDETLGFRLVRKIL